MAEITMTTDICEIISSYIHNPRYELLDWIDIRKLNLNYLSFNKNAIDFLRENPEHINWHLLSGNINAISLLEENEDKIDWYILSGNPNAIKLLKNNIDKINYDILSTNSNQKIIYLLKSNPTKY